MLQLVALPLIYASPGLLGTWTAALFGTTLLGSALVTNQNNLRLDLSPLSIDRTYVHHSQPSTTTQSPTTTKSTQEKIEELIKDKVRDHIRDKFVELIKTMIDDANNSPAIGNEYCRIDTKLLSENQPLILNPVNNEILEPDYYGIIKISKGESFMVVCEAPNILKRITCQDEGVFVDDSKKKFNIYDIKCLKTYELATYTGNKCMDNYKEIFIGFNIPGGKFIKTLDICFDDETKTVLYSKHKMSKSIASCLNKYDMPNRLNPNLFGINPNLLHDLYTKNYQRIHINELLNVPRASLQFIDNDDKFLGRGDLTGHCDFAYIPQQKLSFYYVNVAPQWMTTKSGNWRSLENGLKIFVSEKGKANDVKYTIYSGTYGRSKLRNVDIYLKEENAKKIVYIPEVFWKILYNDQTKEGLVFLVVNNPHLGSYKPICKNTCPNNPPIPINWEKDDKESGFAYCCELNDFLSVVNVPIK